MFLPEAIIPPLLRATHANAPFLTEAGAIEEVRKLALTPTPCGPPKHLRRDVTVTVRREGPHPVYTVTPSKTTATGHVIYVHGGGWVHEISRQHWALIAQIAAEANTTVTVPIYDLLPHGNAGSAHDLVVTLFQQASEHDNDVRLAGDSAGGQIALSAALTLRDQGHTSIRTVLLSPALDLTFSNPQIPVVLPTDPWLGIDGGRYLGNLWAGDLPVEDPRVSPLNGDFARLGPMMILTGTHDVLNPDAHLLVTNARAAGVQVTVVERRNAIHVFPLLPTRPSATARSRIVEALRVGKPA
ncbi:alpha/beta hydrolase fold domain-containing protein [Curtobacterium sp. B18]|uniref:alpha/beta hydrolase fold domain-containing protein n=1 Tax=Curtobacterium sp. B18 TaxID=95614 RepID=UPI0003B785B7|nr:alpha/beta hydrolase fold domain-containing protein [Curtobacterium sp. B18]